MSTSLSCVAWWRRRRRVRWELCIVCLLAATGVARAQGTLHAPFGELLDLYVRDGQVYYRALQQTRAKLDRYVSSLDVPAATYDTWSRADQAAFWLNAYNAFVLQSVIDHYPIQGHFAGYPTKSIRQIGGVFERQKHRAAGRSVTLDEIETEILPTFDDPRMLLALGRGAVGSTRLRSEAFTGARLEAQLEAAASEFAATTHLLQVDTTTNVITVSPILSWREAEFVKAYGDGPAGSDGAFAQRSPIERAILHLVEPYLLPLEQAMLDRNDFTMVFGTFDWRLNDLTGGRVD